MQMNGWFGTEWELESLEVCSLSSDMLLVMSCWRAWCVNRGNCRWPQLKVFLEKLVIDSTSRTIIEEMAWKKVFLLKRERRDFKLLMPIIALKILDQIPFECMRGGEQFKSPKSIYCYYYHYFALEVKP